MLRVYLRRTLPEGATPARLVSEVYESMGDRERLTDLLASVDDELLEDLLGRLEDYEREFDPAATEVAIEVLLNQLPRLREGRRGMMDAGAEIALTRVVLRVLRRVDDEEGRLAIVRRVLPRVGQLSGREELVDLVGHRENVGHRLVTEAASEEFYRALYEQVVNAEPNALAKWRRTFTAYALSSPASMRRRLPRPEHRRLIPRFVPAAFPGASCRCRLDT